MNSCLFYYKIIECRLDGSAAGLNAEWRGYLPLSNLIAQFIEWSRMSQCKIRQSHPAYIRSQHCKQVTLTFNMNKYNQYEKV